MSKKILYNSFKLLIVAVSLTVVTYAWFVKEEKGNVNDIDAYVDAVTQVDVSTNGGETWNLDGLAEITEGLIFDHEITGDGITLYVPALKDNVGTPSYFSMAVEGADYVDIPITFKSSKNAAIFLEKGSAAIPAAGTDEEKLCCTNEVVNQSADGNFSKDLIAGAVRIAFIENDENNVPTNNIKMVWAPNKNYEISLSEGRYISNLNSTNDQDYRCLDIIDSTHYTYKNVEKLYDTIKVSKDEKKSYGEPYLVYAREEELVTITARIWIEGNDRETVAALKGGKFRLKLSFLAISKEISEPPTVEASGETILGANETMEISIDNGSSWQDYNSSMSFNNGDTVLIRVKETTSVLESKIVTLQF